MKITRIILSVLLSLVIFPFMWIFWGGYFLLGGFFNAVTYPVQFIAGCICAFKKTWPSELSAAENLAAVRPWHKTVSNPGGDLNNV